MSLPFRSRRLASGALAALLLATPAVAQEVDRPFPPSRRSPFELRGEGDIARTSMRMQGEWMMYAINTGPGDDFGGPGYSFFGLLGTRNRPNGIRSQFFGMGSPYAGAPRGEWLRHLQEVPSLANALPRGEAQGWTSIINLTSFGEPRQFNAADGQFGRAFSGVASTEDGSCRDHSQTRGGYQLEAGYTLLAGSNCPETWPIIDGVPTFLGSHPVTGDAWLRIFQDPAIIDMKPDSFEFSWWRVPPEYQDRSRFFGDFATYGQYNDFNSTTLPQFGNVVPGQSGQPTLPGWPLGLEFTFDAFSYALPTLQNVSFWRAILTNKSEEVYGVGLDYDSLYIGFAHEHGRRQESAVYFDPVRNTIFSAEGGTSGPGCNGGVPLFSANCGDIGFGDGATALIVLKSPIGDMRNKLFTDPTSPFYSPTNVYRGDTITFNHGHLCDYGSCFTALGGLDDNPRKLFGFYSSTYENLLYDQTISSLPEAVKALTFRNPFYPNEFVPFAHTVPGHCRGNLCNPAPEWTYTRRPASAPPGPDTLWFDNCGPAGCSAVWSDTMAAPGRYINQEANNGMWGVGPFRLAHNDTVGIVLAIIGAPDSASLEAYVANAIDFYMKFYLAPAAAPPVRVVASQVEGVNALAGDNEAAVTLFLNDTLETHVDPFLLDFANKMEAAAPGTREYRIRQLNPGIVERIRERASDNVARLFVFKSCDGGRTFTADADCRPDPAVDLTGRAIGPGWRAYAELTPTESGFPNVFRDGNVIAGRTYLYVLVAETRGADFAIVDSVDTDADGLLDAVAPAELDVAPSILNSLTTSTSDPNVVAVYVPAGVQAGSRAATFTVTQTGAGPTSLAFEVERAGNVSGGQYRVIFGNQFTITRRYVDGVLDSTQVQVAHVVDAVSDPGGPGETLHDDHALSAQTFRTTNPAGVTLNGPTELVSSQTQGNVTTEVLKMDGLGFVLLEATASQPLLVSTVLEADRTTPGAFFGRPDFPGFQVSADMSDAGAFVRQYYVDAAGDSLLDRVRPTVGWASSVAAPAADADELGMYAIEWVAPPFGSGAPFRLNRLNPQETEQALNASLAGRAVGSTGRTDPEALEAVRAALGDPSLAPEDLIAVKAPFRIRNLTMDRDVDIAMVGSGGGRAILLGDAPDTMRVAIPPDVWVPGDRLMLIETVTQDSTVNGRVVLDTNGNPIRVTRPAVTMLDAVLDCGSTPRPTCNPVIGDGQTGYLDVTPGLTLRVHYGNPFDPRTAMDLDIVGSLAGADILERGEIRSLDAVRVVPNPYLMFSRYETSIQERRVLFTNLPPRGTIRIYTATGAFVQQITWTEADVGSTGDLAYNLRTHEGNELASGLYVFRVETTDPATGRVRSKIGKFVVIR